MEGGRAIGVAMSLYAIVADSNMVALTPECPSPSPFVINTNPTSNGALNFITLFPNPTSQNLTISSHEEISELIIYGIDFKSIYTAKPYAKKVNISLPDVPMGVYFVSIQTSKGVHSEKFVLLK